MIGVQLNQAKGLFFDHPRVTGAVDKATRKVLSKFGAFVRTRARSSIRKRNAVSAPGEPPSSHTGLLKNNILFLFSPESRSVVIGPILLNKRTDAPRILEHGDTVVRRRRNRRVRMNYERRPFMGPAFEAEQQSLPKLWRDSVR